MKKKIYPLISIIIPVYNSEVYLNDCIDSILSQNSKNIEVILIDDGSIDKSGEICDIYAKSYECVSVLHVENGGVSRARNLGIKSAVGQYIMFVDSDDELEENSLNEIQKILNNDYHQDIIIFGYTVESKYKKYDVIPPNGIMGKEQFGKLYLLLYQEFLINSPCNKVFCRNLFDKEIIFPEDMSLGEDLIFCNNYLRKCNRFCVVDSSLYKYKQREQESLTTTYYDNLFELYCKHYWDVCSTMAAFETDWDRKKCIDLYKIYYKYVRLAINTTAAKNNKDSLSKKIKKIKAICENALTIECTTCLSTKGIYDFLVKKKYVLWIIAYVKLWEHKAVLKSRRHKK